jgi:Mrp family chromosome partitioning ATPase
MDRTTTAWGVMAGAMGETLARVRAAFNPALTSRLGEFEDAVAAFQAVPRRAAVVAVVGLVPGAGRSTVAGLTALTAAAYSDRRVVVIDAAAQPHTVTELLGGNVADGRLGTLLDGVVTSGVPRRRVRAALTPGAAAPVLSLPPGSGDFAPQMLEQTLDRLHHRADLIVIDAPPGPSHPVLHAVLDLAGHFLLVVRADDNADAQVAAAAEWLASAPGRHRRRPASVVAVSRGLRALEPRTAGVMVLRRDEALRRRQLGRISRRSAVTGLRLATVAAASTA